MLWTSNSSTIDKTKKEFKIYYLIEQQGNDPIIPDKQDLEQYTNGIITWQGFKLNFLEKLMRPEAEELMKKVSVESVSEDVVLVSDESDVEKCYRIMVAEMIVNMFSGHLKLKYRGEL
jgi:hypothetical protein